MPGHPEQSLIREEKIEEDWSPKYLEPDQIIELLEAGELSLESRFQGEKNPEAGQCFEVFSGPGKYAVKIMEAEQAKAGSSRWNIRIKLIKQEE